MLKRLLNVTDSHHFLFDVFQISITIFRDDTHLSFIILPVFVLIFGIFRAFGNSLRSAGLSGSWLRTQTWARVQANIGTRSLTYCRLRHTCVLTTLWPRMWKRGGAAQRREGYTAPSRVFSCRRSPRRALRREIVR